MKTDNNDFILVVDDDSASRMILTKIARSAGYQVESVSNGKICLEFLAERIPDLILMDVLMPDINGTDLCVRIKNIPKYSEVLIILISGVKVTPEDHAFGLEIGADDYISRPFEKRELIARVQAVFRLRNTMARNRRIKPFTSFDQSNTSVTAQAFDQQSVKITYPKEYKELKQRYFELLKKSIELRIYKSEDQLSDQILELARELQFYKAGARDIIDIHKDTLENVHDNESAIKSFYIKEESRILLVEMMGHLMNLYRNRL